MDINVSQEKWAIKKLQNKTYAVNRSGPDQMTERNNS